VFPRESDAPVHPVPVGRGDRSPSTAAVSSQNRSIVASAPTPARNASNGDEDRVMTPLALAAKAGDLAAIEILLDFGADLALVRAVHVCLLVRLFGGLTASSAVHRPLLVRAHRAKSRILSRCGVRRHHQRRLLPLKRRD